MGKWAVNVPFWDNWNILVSTESGWKAIGRCWPLHYPTAEDRCLTLLHPRPALIRSVMDRLTPDEPVFMRTEAPRTSEPHP